MKYTPKYKLTPWDCEHIQFGIYRYCLTIKDIRELLGGVSRETAYAHARRWIDLGYAFRSSGYILFTQKAYHYFDVPFYYHSIGRQNLEHYADTNMVEAYLRQRDDMILMYWKGERLIRHEASMHDSYEYENGQTHIPDAIAEVYLKDTGQVWEIAIEIERSYKGPRRTDDILAILAANHTHVWYFTVGHVYPLIERRIQCLPAVDVPKFEMWELDTIREWQEDRFSSRNDLPQAQSPYGDLELERSI